MFFQLTLSLFSLQLLTFPMVQAHDQSLAVRCFQCSEFPSDPEDQDEPMGPCPGKCYYFDRLIKVYLGWLRPPVIFPAVSVYDGCMTILLSNGSIVAQSGVVYDTCLELQVIHVYHTHLYIQSLQGEAPEYVNETFFKESTTGCLVS